MIQEQKIMRQEFDFNKYILNKKLFKAMILSIKQLIVNFRAELSFILNCSGLTIF